MNFITKLFANKWALYAPAFKSLKVAADRISLSDFDEVASPVNENIALVGNVAVISIDGILIPHASPVEQILGFTDTNAVKDAIMSCEASPLVEKIVLYINSPGGCTLGINSTAEVVRQCTKPVYSYSDSICASASFHIGAAAPNGIYASDDAEIGGVGVYSFITSDFAYAEKEGFAPTLIKSGKNKAIGIMPITDEERAIIQAECDEIYEMFKESVLLTRTIADDDLQGLTYMGQTAIDKGFINGVVGSIEELVSYLAG